MAAQSQAQAESQSQSQSQSRPSQPLHSQIGTSRPAQTQTQAQASDPLYPPQLGAPGAAGLDDAPPSYEDAIADEIGPVDGPRRDWSGVTNENAPTDLGDGDGDEKSRRLFV
jgi:hypothetical protein